MGILDCKDCAISAADYTLSKQNQIVGEVGIIQPGLPRCARNDGRGDCRSAGPHRKTGLACGAMRFAYMDVGEGREQDAEVSLIVALQLQLSNRPRGMEHNEMVFVMPGGIQMPSANRAPTICLINT